MTVLITGARGNIGSAIVTRLAADGHAVRASARDTTTLDVPAGVETATLDLTRFAGKTLTDVETLFLYPTRGDCRDFLTAAKEAGVQYVVLLSSPASFEHGECDGPIGLVHRGVEQALADSGLRHTILYPSWLATNARRDWGEEIRAENRISLAHPDAQVSPIHLDDIAEVAAALLTEDAHRGRMQVLTGPESLTQREIAGVLAEETGRAITIAELTREQALARRAPWMPESVLAALLDASALAVGVPALLTNTVERITGHPARPFRAWAAAHLADFG
ncbi:NAD(P)H-binding protein [Amycolatopsis minnesotensis]|uniref:NAD(P)H-binding protein n=1 Tax=Amycolatopsis minnesotensis TaxID=337894 RepID=A0ABP5BFA1_9PSEU